jgi:Dyp-type peroxidase family
MSEIDPAILADTQVNVLRGLRHRFARLVHLRFAAPAQARAWLAVARPHVAGGGQLGVAAPPVALGLAFTAAGLAHLTADRFDGGKPYGWDVFEGGIEARADELGDILDSAPDRWEAGFRDGFHVLVSIWADSAEALEAAIAGPYAALLTHAAVAELAVQRGERRVDNKEPFGFLDGVASPKLAGLPAVRDTGPEGSQSNLPIALDRFLIGGERPPLPDGAAPTFANLARNGTFMVLRKLHQDVEAFNGYLQANAGFFTSAEKLAALMVGRWQNGTPLTSHPHRPAPGDQVMVDDFDFYDDQSGAPNCPKGSHIRRMNPRPRGPSVVHARKILRRGYPYAETRDGQVEQGLLFVALNADIRDQFENLQRFWAGDAALEEQVRGVYDPILGAHDRPGAARLFRGRTPTTPYEALPRFVNVRGGAYLFVPSLSALRLLEG